MIKAVKSIGFVEWADITMGEECEWTLVENAREQIIHVRGEGEVGLFGSLFPDDQDGELFDSIGPGDLRLKRLPMLPWRIRPALLGVEGSKVTVRLYIPRA